MRSGSIALCCAKLRALATKKNLQTTSAALLRAKLHGVAERTDTKTDTTLQCKAAVYPEEHHSAIRRSEPQCPV
jgi:hypothetical protein